MATSTLNEVVGRNVRRIRTDAGLTLDQVASRASSLGLKWTPSRVVELEKGQLAVSFQVMLVLAHVLGQLRGELLHLVEFFDGDDWVWVSRTEQVSSVVLKSAVTGHHVNFDDNMAAEDMERVRDRYVEARERLPEVPAGVTVADLKFMHDIAGLADRRAAKKLGMTLDQFLGYAFITWRNSLTNERNRLAGEGAPAQRMGQVTRDLVEHIEMLAIDTVAVEEAKARG